MDSLIVYLLGVLTGVVMVIGCAAGAFCCGANDLNDQGEHDDW
ncbi:MAG: hypothetical protein ACTIJ4_01670 [Halomonas sp.]|nr:hypothetical protein [Halomonas profundi]